MNAYIIPKQSFKCDRFLLKRRRRRRKQDTEVRIGMVPNRKVAQTEKKKKRLIKKKKKRYRVDDLEEERN